MNTTSKILSGLLIAICANAYAGNPEKAKSFRSVGANINAKLIIAPHEKDFYLIHFSGFEHKFDNKTLLYKKRSRNHSGKRGEFFQLAGSHKITFSSTGKRTLIRGTVYDYAEVRLNKKLPTRVVFADNVGVFTVRKMKKQYLETQGLLESRIAANKLLNSALSRFHSQCHAKLKLNIDWNGFNAIQQKTTPGMAYAYLDSLTRICKIDKDYREAASKIQSFTVSPSKNKKTSVSLSNKDIHLKLHKDTPNVFENSYAKLKNLF